MLVDTEMIHSAIVDAKGRVSAYTVSGYVNPPMLPIVNNCAIIGPQAIPANERVSPASETRLYVASPENSANRELLGAFR